MFWDKYPTNMYYSTSRRGSLNASVLPPPEVPAYDTTAADWTCSKVRQTFDSGLYVVVDGIDTDCNFTCTVTLSDGYATQ